MKTTVAFKEGPIKTEYPQEVPKLVALASSFLASHWQESYECRVSLHHPYKYAMLRLKG